MIEYSELVTPVVNNLEIGNNATDIERFNIVSNLNAIQLQLLNTLDAKYLVSAVRTVRFAVTSGVSEYQWPESFIRFRQLRIDYENPISESNEGIEAIIYDPSKHHLPINSLASKRYPMIDLDIEQGFKIAPTPTASVSNGFQLKYIYKLPEISPSQNSLLTANCKNLLIFGATMLSALVDNYRPDLSKFYAQLYQDELKRFLPKAEGQ